jgi:membrane-bound serine protease (ClpP class)
MAALFVLGIVFILLEILLFPGVVVLALGGSLLVLVALFFAMADFYPAQPVDLSFDFLLTPMLNISIALIGAVFFIAFLARFLPEIPIMRRLFLSFSQPRTIPEPPASAMPGAPRISPGDTGEALTILRPAGRASIGGEPVDVMTGGDFIEAGTPVRVLSVSGTTVVVGRNG